MNFLERFPVRKIKIALLLALLLAAVLFAGALLPRTRSAAPLRSFAVSRGDGFREIIDRLYDGGFIRSPLALKIFTLLRGRAYVLKAGVYELSPSMSGPRILGELVSGVVREVQVVIPEGSSLYDVDSILSASGVIEEGALVQYAIPRRLEGYLFPDTYKFFWGASVEEVVGKFLSNFELKARGLLARDPKAAAENLILASLIEREVTSEEDGRVVAGILKKRLRAQMPLQVDATICYIKKIKAGKPTDCYPLNSLDFAEESPYNTYLRVGLPAGPIGSPGTRAIAAALAPYESRYWYYLSNPETGKTIFSETLDEQEQNRVKYLRK